MPRVSAHDLYLFAVNTGSFYERHKQMARDHASQQKWFLHVSGRVLELYKRQIEPVLAWPSDRFDAARQLKDYYEQHIKELAA